MRLCQSYWGEAALRQNRQMLALIALAGITLIFALGFFFGRRSMPFAVSAEAALSQAVPPGGLEGAESAQAQKSGSDAPDEPQSIDLNTADMQALMTLPRVGEVLAQRILDYRAQYGRFSACEQLMDVEGIGEGIFAGLREFIYVEDEG